jgi:hypothetical protein
MSTIYLYLLTLFVVAMTQLCEKIPDVLARIFMPTESKSNNLNWSKIFNQALAKNIWGGFLWGNFLYFLFVKDNADPIQFCLLYFVGFSLCNIAWTMILFIRSKLFAPKESNNT